MTDSTVTDDRTALGSVVGDAEHFLHGVFGRSTWLGRSPDAAKLFGIADVDRIVSSASAFRRSG